MKPQIYSFQIFLDQEHFFCGVTVKKPYGVKTSYEVINDEITRRFIEIPDDILHQLNMSIVSAALKAACENNAYELGHIGQSIMVTVHEILKIK